MAKGKVTRIARTINQTGTIVIDLALFVEISVQLNVNELKK